MRYRQFILGAVLSAALVLFFQNCSQGSLTAANSVSSNSVKTNSTTEMPVANFVNNLKAQAAVSKVSITDESGAVKYKITINENRAMVEEYSSDMVILLGCLNETDLSNIKSYFSNTSLCQGKAPENGVSCAQKMDLPYAYLEYLGVNVPLGKGSVCESQYVYLCGVDNLDNAFRNYIADIKANIKNKVSTACLSTN